MPAAADRADADADDGEATNADITLDGDDETTAASVRRV